MTRDTEQVFDGRGGPASVEMAAAERSPTRAGSPASADYCSDSGGGRGKSFHLDLENFDADGVPDDCPYVLTSPRSLEACKRLRVQVSRIANVWGQYTTLLWHSFFGQITRCV